MGDSSASRTFKVPGKGCLTCKHGGKALRQSPCGRCFKKSIHEKIHFSEYDPIKYWGGVCYAHICKSIHKER